MCGLQRTTTCLAAASLTDLHYNIVCHQTPPIFSLPNRYRSTFDNLLHAHIIEKEFFSHTRGDKAEEDACRCNGSDIEILPREALVKYEKKKRMTPDVCLVVCVKNLSPYQNVVPHPYNIIVTLNNLQNNKRIPMLKRKYTVIHSGGKTTRVVRLRGDQNDVMRVALYSGRHTQWQCYTG